MIALVCKLFCAGAVEHTKHVGFRQPFPFLQLMEDVVGSYDSILQIRAGLALEAERLGHIEHNQLAARELEHEIADGGDANLPAHAGAVIG